MSDGGAGNGGNGDAEAAAAEAAAAAFATSQEAIGLGTLGLTATESADISAQGVGAAYGYGVTPDTPDISGPSPSLTDISPGPEPGGEDRDRGGGEEIKPVEEKPEAYVTRKEEQAKARKRRRSLLGIEEEGLLAPANVYRRSLLG